jgi:anti-anti-sigma factor
MTPQPQRGPTLQLERRDGIAVLTPSLALSTAPEDVVERTARLALDPLRAEPPRGVVVDLSQVDAFGSIFLAFLVRCHTLAKKQGGRMVVAGPSPRARDLFRLTALDTLWEAYPDHTEAVRALASAAT